MIEALHDRLVRIDVNPRKLSDDVLSAMFEMSKRPDLPMPLRFTIGLFAADEIKRRGSDDPALIEASYMTIDLLGMDTPTLSATLGGALMLLQSNLSSVPGLADVIHKLVSQVVAHSRARLERGF